MKSAVTNPASSGIVQGACRAIDASVIICTFNRPEMLAKAVKSSLSQSASFAFEVIVVDNSRDSNANGVLLDMVAHDSRLRYVAMPCPNVSLARNAGVAAARGEFVAFLDDDEEADPVWLSELVRTLRASEADCAYGPVLPRFHENKGPDWDPTGWWFTRNADEPTGTDYCTARKSRLNRAWIGAGNSIIRVATCVSDSEPFDPSYGRTGGEDAVFFERLIRRGRRIVWCATAKVWETIPPERTELSYQLFRYRYFCQLSRQRAFRSELRALLTWAKIIIMGLLRVLVWGTICVMTDTRSFNGVRARFGFTCGLGSIQFVRSPPMYGGATNIAGSVDAAGISDKS